MWKVIVPFLLGSSVVEARQDAQAQPRFFSQKTVDFWRDGSPTRTGDAAQRPTPSESIWAEPIRLPDGRTTTYVPPRPVLEFLENPTRENARKYLDWQVERMEKMRKAAALLAELQREKSPKPPEGDIVAGAPVTVTYFKKTDCPACARQDVVLSDLKERFPHLAIKALEVGQEPELWRRLGVTAVPTLQIAAPGRRPVLLRGYADADKILSTIKGAPHEGK